MLSDITAITVNFKTPDLVYDCLNSFRCYYLDMRHIVVDNGGCAASLDRLRKLTDKGFVELIKNERNAGHGPALNQGLALVETAYAFLLDSDTRTEQGGFLEKMLALFAADPLLFAVGWLRKVGKTGVAYRHQDTAPDSALSYIHPYACLLDVEKFRELRPFKQAGAPALETMYDARARGYHVAGFPVSDYIWHKVAGTRGLFGGRCRVRTDEKPGKWKKRRI